MPKGYSKEGKPLSPPTKQKTKAKKKGPYAFSQDIVDILEGCANATAHIENCLRLRELYSAGGRYAHSSYLFDRIQVLEAIRDYERDLTEQETQELTWLNKAFDEVSLLPMKD